MYLVVIGLSCLATWWTVWPDKYVACLETVKNKLLRRTPAMHAVVDRVEAVSPLSSSKPWYPGFMRLMGILMWVTLLCIAYMAYRF